jgi:hypothetical protein
MPTFRVSHHYVDMAYSCVPRVRLSEPSSALKLKVECIICYDAFFPPPHFIDWIYENINSGIGVPAD